MIAVWKGGGVSLREIARRLRRSHSTIIDEIRRNSFRDSSGQKYYVAIHAQAKTTKRKFLAGRRHSLKDAQTYSYVVHKLREGWSPELIAGRLKKRHGRTVVCPETIYRFVYGNNTQAVKLKLWEYLPRKQKKRRRQKGRRTGRVRIPDRVSIHLRPARVDKKVEPGHWEADTMEGRRLDKDGIHIQLERLTRKILARKVSSISAPQTLSAQQRVFLQIPGKLRKTITFDNGLENTKHIKLHKLGFKTYFTDPYSAWQKGAVENGIGLVRRYLPKGTSLKTLTQEELDDIIEEINSRPRKVLNYSTPNEVFNFYLSGRIQS